MILAVGLYLSSVESYDFDSRHGLLIICPREVMTGVRKSSLGHRSTTADESAALEGLRCDKCPGHAGAGLAVCGVGDGRDCSAGAAGQRGHGAKATDPVAEGANLRK